jgi:hypothetical protein
VVSLAQRFRAEVLAPLGVNGLLNAFVLPNMIVSFEGCCERDCLLLNWSLGRRRNRHTCEEREARP